MRLFWCFIWNKPLILWPSDTHPPAETSRVPHTDHNSLKSHLETPPNSSFRILMFFSFPPSLPPWPPGDKAASHPSLSLWPNGHWSHYIRQKQRKDCEDKGCPSLFAQRTTNKSPVPGLIILGLMHVNDLVKSIQTAVYEWNSQCYAPVCTHGGEGGLDACDLG